MEKIKWSEKVTNTFIEHIGEKKALLNTQLPDDLRNRRRYWELK